MRKGSDLHVGEAITVDPVTIDGTATVNEALAVMRERNISSIVVQRKDADDDWTVSTSRLRKTECPTFSSIRLI
jgi:CBS domain-containing protein